MREHDSLFPFPKSFFLGERIVVNIAIYFGVVVTKLLCLSLPYGQPAISFLSLI
jgi:hypothetical protein